MTGANLTTTKTCSHVLSAMGLDEQRIDAALRFSWHHDTPQPDWAAFVAAVQRLRHEVAASFLPPLESPLAGTAHYKSLRGR